MEKIKNLFTFIILSIISLSCNSETNKLDLTINIENDTIHAYSDTLGSKTMNIIKYSITNNSNELYYINSINSLVAIKGLNSNGKIIRVFNENNSEVKYISLVHDYNKKFDFDCYECNMKMSEKFMEKYYNLTKDFDDNSNFYYKYNGLAFINFIPAKSTIHFEYLINLSNFTIYDESRYGFVNLDKN
jgi:hypothetical protein